MIKGLENLKIFLSLLCPGVSRCVQGAQCSSNFSQFPLRAAELGTDLIHTLRSKSAAEDSPFNTGIIIMLAPLLPLSVHASGRVRWIVTYWETK